MKATSLRVPGADGLALHVLEWSQQGVPMLFLHGYGNDAHVWDQVCPELAAHYRVLAFDLRGHGDSDWHPDGRYDHASMADDIEAAIQSLAIDRLVLVGHSMGGRVAMHVAGRIPERMAALIVVDSGPEMDARGVTRIQLEASQGPPRFSSVREYERLLSTLYPAVLPQTLAHLARHWTRQAADGTVVLKLDPKLRGGGARRPDPADWRRAAEDESQRLWDALKAIACPALVVRGAASDVFSPEVADRMVDEVLANGRLAIIPRASHSVMLDNPQGFGEVLASFALG